MPDLADRVRNQLTLPLPGMEYQFQMAHLSRIIETPVRADVRKAAVLVLLFRRANAWQIVLIQRKSIEGDVHSGQISFPGGRARLHESIEETALRESYEEIGSPRDDVSIIGNLTSLHIPVSNHLVYPVVGYLHSTPRWSPQKSEVEAIVEVPIGRILDPQTRVRGSISLREDLILKDVPCYDIDGHLIWGATAMILSEFSAVLSQADPVRL